MRRRDIRAARKESIAQDWSVLAANDEHDEFDYQSPTACVEPKSDETTTHEGEHE